MDKRWNDKLNSLLDILSIKHEKGTWMTANQLNKSFGITHRDLFNLRRHNQVEIRSTGKKSWMYKLESIPEPYFKKQTV